MTMIMTGFRLKFVAKEPACLDDSSIFKFLIESASSSFALPLSLISKYQKDYKSRPSLKFLAIYWSKQIKFNQNTYTQREKIKPTAYWNLITKVINAQTRNLKNNFFLVIEQGSWNVNRTSNLENDFLQLFNALNKRSWIFLVETWQNKITTPQYSGS